MLFTGEPVRAEEAYRLGICEFLSGEEDPLGDYGKGVRKTVMDFLETGHRNVHMKLYPGRRHEIHKEPGCEDVLQDILSFCEAQ